MFGLAPDIQVYKTSIFKLEALNKPEDDRATTIATTS